MRHVSLFVTLLSVGLAVAAPGWAGERLAMPFECGVDGDEVRLAPAAETIYAIVGEREQQAVTACNPASSTGCRTIMVHSFAISCGGISVTWMQVAAAVHRTGDKRTWIEDGHLNVMLPSRAPAPAPSDCLGQSADAGSGLERRVVLRRDCLPWRRHSQIDHVVLPAGYAPVGELGARLVFDAPQTQPIQLARVDPEAIWEPTVEIGPFYDGDEGIESADAGSDWVTVVRTAAQPGVRVPRNESGMPGIWPWLLSAMVVATAALFAHLRYPQSLPARLLPVGTSRKRSELSDPSHAGQVVNALIERTDGVVKGLKGAAALREVLQSELDRVHRTLANVEAAGRNAGSEYAEHETKSASVYRALVRDLERIQRIADGAATSFSGRQRSAELPRTKSEAYEVLGVNADVSETVLKKIADALRMSWHPDHARNEDDRKERETRIRQINAAWELIAQKHASV